MRKALILAASAGLAACSAVDRAAVRSTAGALERGRLAVLEEPDYDLAREAFPAQLKLLETLLASAPRDLRLRRLAAEGFAGSAFLFLEETAPERAKGLYRRGRDHALAALALKPAFRGLADKDLEGFGSALKSAGPDDVPDLYWAGFGWAGLVNLSKDDPSVLAELPKAVALLERSAELDPAFQFGGADVALGVYHASRPAILGGDPRKAKAAFDRARAVHGGKFLMAGALEARWHAVATQDRERFAALLEGVAAAPAGALPGARLADEAAKRRAAALLANIDEYF